MRIKHIPEDFQVEELIHLPGERGAYAYYRVEKRDISTLEVRDILAARLKLTPSMVTFPALKDAGAIAVQYASVRKRGAEQIRDKGFIAQRVGWGPRALQPKDVLGNRFTIVVRDLSEQDALTLTDTLRRLETEGLPNYFDEQRFGSLTAKGFIGKAILMRDAEQVVHFYLEEPMLGDPADVREFKALVKSHWGQWGFLLHQAPRPSNLRSVITYLKDHPHDYGKAVNLIQDRLLSIYLAAYQSWVWNHIAARCFERAVPVTLTLDIVGTAFPLPTAGVVPDDVKKLEIDLPRLTACYTGIAGEAAEAVFAAEGLTLHDFKARILQRVYLAKGERGVWFAPTDVVVRPPSADEYFPGRQAITVNFTLPSGCYATLVVKAAAAYSGILVEGKQ
ncbi:MAG TPA: tRNA pseudouridine(13) synthase TruD [Anaerolineae bacterium]|nr:tRNA pseudouridine(13) synthase TruD [Anaerolineae bacterium]HQK14258.1 tRNA pseudouridine(13) synthase TruD [Anaerolineae bacterium]